VGVKGANTLRNYAGGYTGRRRQCAGTSVRCAAGDANDDNCVLLVDFSILRGTFGKCQGDAAYDPRADFNGDACVTLHRLLAAAHAAFGVCGDMTARAATNAAHPP
jgi:hypothetical protein